MADSASNSKYKILKQEISKVILTSDIPKVKVYFSSSIQSRRTLSRIKTLPELFFVLEKRNALHKNDVSALVCLGEYLENSEIVTLSKVYTKLLYLDELIEPEICVCGSSEASFKKPDLTTPSSDIDISLQNVMKNLAFNIEGKWRILARELDVKEYHIDKIGQIYQKTYDQAMNALLLWKEWNGEEATEGALKKALESRLCKLHGLGVHMLEKSITIQ